MLRIDPYAEGPIDPAILSRIAFASLDPDVRITVTKMLRFAAEHGEEAVRQALTSAAQGWRDANDEEVDDLPAIGRFGSFDLDLEDRLFVMAAAPLTQVPATWWHPEDERPIIRALGERPDLVVYWTPSGALTTLSGLSPFVE